MEEGKYAQMAGYLSWWELSLGKWWRSTIKVDGKYPYGGYLSDKKWYLNEVRNNNDWIPRFIALNICEDT